MIRTQQANQLKTETIATEVDRLMTRQYESQSDTVPGRYIGFDLGITSADPQEVAFTRYGYDAAGRLNAVNSANANYSYKYLANSNLIEEIEGNVHKVNYSYETGRNAMTSLTNTVSSTTVSSYGSRYDALGRRIDVTRTGTAFVQDHLSKYYYDSLGQLTDDQRYEGANPETPGTALEAETFAFLYDTIGNRKESIQGSSTSTYTSNSLNQYSDIAGLIEMEPIHDDDGNLVQDANNTYIWNGENRLIRVEPIIPTNGSKRVEFTYDYLGRRVSKTVLIYNTASWQADSVTAFVYDGWNVVEETTSTLSETISRIYTWGLDLSGSLQGAGGVGGLLAQTYSDSSATQTYYYTYDFNGNVSELLDASGSISAHYQYSPFGQITHQYGDFANENSYRFSTKPIDTEIGLYYYGYRFYDAETGRWLNRDPIGERGGENLYGFVENDGINYVDFLGYWKIYDFLKNHPNYRLELSISALTRKFDWRRIPILHDTLKSYGIILESKQVKYKEQNCIELVVSAFGNAGALKNAIKSSVKKVPVVKKYAKKVDADVLLAGGGKIIDCPCFKKSDLVGGFDVKIQASGGYGIFGGKRSGGTDHRTGQGGKIRKSSLNGIRGPFIGAFAEWGLESIISDTGLDVELKGGASGFIGMRGSWLDFRAGGEVTGKWTFSLLPEFESKGGDWNATWF